MLEPNRVGYLVLYAAAAVAYATAAVIAQRRAGGAALRTTATVGTAILLLLGVLQWNQLAVKETPLVAYLLLAVLPTHVATALIHLSRDRSATTQWIAGAAGFVGALVPAIVIGTYFLDTLIPL